LLDEHEFLLGLVHVLFALLHFLLQFGNVSFDLSDI
jgi:hypothetical protein